MRNFAVIFFVLIAFTANSQYYYRDILVADQTRKQLQQHKKERIRSVSIVSFEGNGQPVDDFQVEQSYNNNYTEMSTNTRSMVANPSDLKTSFDNAGRVTKTTDTTDGFKSTTEYKYNTDGKLVSMTNLSVSAGQSEDLEQHLWFYGANGKPQRMIKIKNQNDSSIFNFVLDEKGNVVEENGNRKNAALPSVYYYYDNQNRLTDIVRYNQKARRLLPDYVFEYNEQDQITSMMVVPEGSDDYQRWIYQYDPAGLKMKETALNKRKQVLGRLEYRYQR